MTLTCWSLPMPNANLPPPSQPRTGPLQPPTAKTTREKIINCALIGATLDEIAAYCGITRATLERRYARDIAQAWARRNVHIRQALTRLALQGNVQALKR